MMGVSVMVSSGFAVESWPVESSGSKATAPHASRKSLRPEQAGNRGWRRLTTIAEIP
jgi:hypothetical protein